MQTLRKIDEFLDSLSKLPIDDQLMIARIIRSRAIEEKRNELAASIKESKAEYRNNKTGKGTIEDFLKDLDEE